MHGKDEVKPTLWRQIPADPTHRGDPRLGSQNHVSEAVQWCLAAVGFVLITPVLLVISLLIKLTSRGPVLYRGLRVGKDRRVFTIYKFRTLVVGAEEKIGRRLLTEHDALYTVMGKFLKRTKLDELPQLLNVLKGEMNLVGPRPIRPVFLESLRQDIPRYDLRFNVKPGMTGLAQVRGGYFTKPKDKLRYELMYLKHRCLGFDLYIIYQTFADMPREFSSGPFSPRRMAKPPASGAHTSLLHRSGHPVSGSPEESPTTNRVSFIKSRLAPSIEFASPQRMGVSPLVATFDDHNLW